MRITRLFLAAGLLVVLSGSIYLPVHDSPTTPPDGPPAQAQAPIDNPEQLVGKYFAGVLILELTADGRYRLAYQPGWVFYGRYTVSDELITFVDDDGPLACPADQEGRYKWSLSNDRLLIETVEDVCQFRNVMITYTAFHRAGFNQHWWDDQVDHPAN